MANATKDKSPTAPAQDTRPGGNPLAGALAQAAADAVAVKPREESGEVVAGPFPVGNIGRVEVRATKRGEHTYTDAVFVPASGGKSKRIPLAAVATLHEELGA